MSTYLTDASINGGALTQSEIHLYGSSRLGIYTIKTNVQSVNNPNAIVTFERANKFFELSNHLGNVLVTISDKKLGVDGNSDGTVDYYNADVITANDMYPFGLEMPGRTYGSGGRYGFVSKERDKETGKTLYDFKFRIYNPGLGRFLSVDALAKDYPYYSTYQYAGNTPIWAIDLDGKEPLKYSDWQYGGWSTNENFKKIQGSKSHVKVVKFGDIYDDGHNYVAIRDQKVPGKWHYATYDDEVGSLGNAQKGNWKLYNPDAKAYEAWKPDGWVADDAEIKQTARHLGEFGRGMENVIVQGTIFGVTAPLGGAGSWGTRLFLNTTIEVGANGKNADAADIITNSLPGAGGLIGVGTGAFLDWSPASDQKSLRKFSSPLFPNTSFTRNKSLLSTGVDILTGATYEGFKFLPKKTIPNLTPGQLNFIDVSGSVQEKAVNMVIKDGVESQNQNP